MYIYANDLASVCRCTFSKLFADDSDLFISDNNADLIMWTLNNEVKEIYCGWKNKLKYQ